MTAWGDPYAVMQWGLASATSNRQKAENQR